MKGFRIEVPSHRIGQLHPHAIGKDWVGLNVYRGYLMHDLKLPAPMLNRIAIKYKKFYFTKKGWNKIGKKLMQDLIQNKVNFRILTIRVHRPYYKDDLQFVQ
jgi:hypothetical protein